MRSLRIARGLNQEALANGIGVTFQQVQKYERGTNRISCSRLYELATMLSVPVAYFFENMEMSFDVAGAQKHTKVQDVLPSLEDKISSRELYNVMHVYAELPLKIRKSLMNHMRVLVHKAAH